ncbi:MAG: dual specificity protein phosphatase family protein [Bacteroidetes bacterium]|nr:dual specificity protein phosphatase family protein [Bacteroidota bacterium]
MARLLIPSLRVYRVTDHFLAGSYPGSMDEAAARDKIEALLELGVHAFINLMEEDEQHWRGGPLRGYQEVLPGLSAADHSLPVMERFPIPDMDIPSGELMTRILDAIDTHLSRGTTVYLHCLGGVGRTGTVVGCWLVRHGHASGKDALDEIDRLREYDPMLDLPSPQTDAQRNMVRSWRKGA